jgi:Protein of unknown function (DUF3891)
MIVKHAGISQLLITQPAHAALSARIMQHWCADGFPEAPRRASILLAIAEHDNGWRELDDAPLVEDGSGRVLDFVSAPDQLRRGIWPRGTRRLGDTPHAAALVAQHALHVYGHYASRPEWTSFFADMTATRDHYLQEAAPLTLDELLGDYAFLRIADLASLTLCGGRTSTQIDELGYQLQMEGSRLIITPDPFEGREVALAIAARAMPARPFPSVEDARRVYQASPQVTVTGTASGP